VFLSRDLIFYRHKKWIVGLEAEGLGTENQEYNVKEQNLILKHMSEMEKNKLSEQNDDDDDDGGGESFANFRKIGNQLKVCVLLLKSNWIEFNCKFIINITNQGER